MSEREKESEGEREAEREGEKARERKRGATHPYRGTSLIRNTHPPRTTIGPYA